MRLVYNKMLYVNMLVYLDDILIATETYEQHLAAVKDVLMRMRRNGMLLNIKKCTWFQKSIEHLGLLLTREGCKPQEGKVQQIRDYRRPNRAA